MPAPGSAVHDLLPHALSRVRARPFPGAARARLRVDALVSSSLGGGDGRDPEHPPRSGSARLRQHRGLVPRRRHRAVPARSGARAAPAAPRSPVRRPGGRGEESGGVPGDADRRGQQAGGRGRPTARPASGEVSRCSLRRRQVRRGPRPPLRQRRRVRLPEPHRHLRAGAARGARLGSAGRSLSGAGPVGRDRWFRVRRARSGPGAGERPGARDPADALPGLRAPVLLAAVRRAVPAQPAPGRRDGEPGRARGARLRSDTGRPPQSPRINRMRRVSAGSCRTCSRAGRSAAHGESATVLSGQVGKLRVPSRSSCDTSVVSHCRYSRIACSACSGGRS